MPIANFGRFFDIITTFIMLYGGFCFKKLSSEATKSPEHFQRKMSEILEGQEGVLCHVHDVLASMSMTPDFALP